MTKHDPHRGDDILAFIEEYRDEHGYHPSIREIQAALGMASTSSVHHHLMKLAREGRLVRTPRTARAMEAQGPTALELTAMAMHRWRHPSFKGYGRCRCEADAEMALDMVSA